MAQTFMELHKLNGTKQFGFKKNNKALAAKIVEIQANADTIHQARQIIAEDISKMEELNDLEKANMTEKANKAFENFTLCSEIRSLIDEF